MTGIETGGGDSTYAWKEELGPTEWQRVTVFPGEAAEQIETGRLRREVHAALGERRPDVVVIAGWGTADARACLSWCRRHGAKAIVMSETREADGQRVWWKEWLKSRIIRRFDAALVGGRSHRDYLVKLGMPAERVAFGYNVVENAYFATEAAKWRERLSVVGCRLSENEATGLSLSDGARIVPPPPYFLASNRFIERKNLLRLIEAYAGYGRAATAGHAVDAMAQVTQANPPVQPIAEAMETSGPARRSSPTWPLVLLGDGEQKSALLARCRELGLHVVESAPWETGENAERGKQKAEIGDGEADSTFQLSDFSVSAFPPPTVYFPGFRQIDELPRFYAHAGCFIHPALEEPWGLVINEAMACSLPILSGNNVGAAEELIDEGVNGWKFDATDAEEIARLMGRISDFDFPLSDFGEASARILEERCPTDAFGRGLAQLLER